MCEYPEKTDNVQEYLRDLACFYHILAENGVIFSINSDAHLSRQLVYAEQAREFLISIGLESVSMWSPKNLECRQRSNVLLHGHEDLLENLTKPASHLLFFPIVLNREEIL